jgi:hypothetical protein
VRDSTDEQTHSSSTITPVKDVCQIQKVIPILYLGRRDASHLYGDSPSRQIDSLRSSSGDFRSQRTRARTAPKNGDQFLDMTS